MVLAVLFTLVMASYRHSKELVRTAACGTYRWVPL